MGWREDEARSLADHREAIEKARRPLSEAERRWIARLKRTLAAKPDSLWVLAGEGALAVYIDTNGEAIVCAASVPGRRVGQLR